ncbi:MAG: RcnB family protein [Brevundimonas sp.]|uniref:RcnB family protein n=1 Tax=Brevundimonas sp. TaxID=1871086 RepID=UPI00391D2A14
MKRSLMVAGAIAAFLVPLATPLAVLAQDPPDERSEVRQRDRALRDQRRPAERPSSPPAEARPSNQERPARAQRPDRPDRPERPGRPETPDRPTRDAGQARPDRPQATPERRQERRDNRSGRPGNREDRRDNRQERRDDRQERRNDRPNRPDRPDNRDDRREYRQERREDRQERRQDRRDYREFRQRFNADVWRRDWNRRHGHDWWRSDRRFRGYSGVRIGFYFAPGHGYYSVPRSHWGQRYHAGQYLPSIFWRYSLDDWRTYGLGYPPEGARWVLVDNHIYLIDRYDGYIIDAVYDAWRW